MPQKSDITKSIDLSLHSDFRKLIDMESYVLFTTHFHELSCLAEKYSQVANLHVKVVKPNDKDVVITYEMIPGKSEGSYGIQIAETLRFPPQVIQVR